jgi:hypothetical protein
MKKDIEKQLKTENNTLLNIYENQIKAIKEFSDKFENKNEINNIQDKYKMLKEEYKLTKDNYNMMNEKLKSHYKLMRTTEEKCRKMKENFEKIKKVNKEKDITEEDIKKIEDNILEVENEMAINEEFYKKEIYNQQSIINELTKNIFDLTNILKDKKNDIKYIEIKNKDIPIGKRGNRNKLLKPIQNKMRSYSSNKSLSESVNINFDNI